MYFLAWIAKKDGISGASANGSQTSNQDMDQTTLDQNKLLCELDSAV